MGCLASVRSIADAAEHTIRLSQDVLDSFVDWDPVSQSLSLLSASPTAVDCVCFLVGDLDAELLHRWSGPRLKSGLDCTSLFDRHHDLDRVQAIKP